MDYRTLLPQRQLFGGGGKVCLMREILAVVCSIGGRPLNRSVVAVGFVCCGYSLCIRAFSPGSVFDSNLLVASVVDVCYSVFLLSLVVLFEVYIVIFCSFLVCSVQTIGERLPCFSAH